MSVAIFPSKPKLVSCGFTFLTRGVGAKFYGPDALPDANQPSERHWPTQV